MAGSDRCTRYRERTWGQEVLETVLRYVVQGAADNAHGITNGVPPLRVKSGGILRKRLLGTQLAGPAT